LKVVVQDCIETIKKDPRCSPLGLTALGRLVDLIEQRLLVVNVVMRRDDAVPFGKAAPSTDVLSTALSSEKTFPRVASFTLPTESSVLFYNERANAMELCEEMESIIEAAKKEDLLAWINWDGVEEAARTTPPLIASLVAGRVENEYEVTRNWIQPYLEVRYLTRILYEDNLLI